MSIKAVFTDYDYTVAIGNEPVNEKILEFTKILRLDMGISVHVITGRGKLATTYSSSFKDYLSITDEYACCNGIVVGKLGESHQIMVKVEKKTFETLYKQFMNLVSDKKSCKLSVVVQGVKQNYYIAPVYYSNQLRAAYIHGYVGTIIVESFDDIYDYHNDEVFSMYITGDLEFLSTLQGKIQAPNELLVFFCKYTGYYIEGHHNKIEAVKYICNKRGYKLDEIIYIGDSENDINCFEGLPLTICMGNGSKNALKAAKFITDRIENNGWISGIKKLLELVNDKENEANDVNIEIAVES